MSNEYLPMNLMDEPFRDVTWLHPYSGLACLNRPFRDDHFEADPKWAIGWPLPKHQTNRIREDDNVHCLIKATPSYFEGNLDPKMFLDWATSVHQYFN